jgi:hypothetical protein
MQCTPKDPTKIFPQILHPGPQNRSQTIVRTPRHLMAAPKTTISDVLGILNAVDKWAYSSRNIAMVALKGLILILSYPSGTMDDVLDCFRLVHMCRNTNRCLPLMVSDHRKVAPKFAAKHKCHH